MSAGKGDAPRPVKGATYRDNWQVIFRKPRKPEPGNVWDNYTPREMAMLGLIDGAYELIEIHGGSPPSSDAWKKEWLRKARALGASAEW